MRTEFCETQTRDEAIDQCPWACEVAEVEGGYMCFESYDDYLTWKNQC